MYQGKLQKARRGELSFPLPIGYVWTADGAIGFDPDAQVQQVVRRIFRKFEDLGTLHALLRYLVQHDIKVGVRLREGLAKGTLAWRRPNRMTLHNMLKHPMYAGAYVYGRRQVDARKKQPGRPSTGRVTQGRPDFHVLLPDQVPAYIPWSCYAHHVARLESNRNQADTLGAVRHGPSLLAGLLICGKCYHRMQVRYGGPRHGHSYTCSRLATDYGGEYCQYLPGEALDAVVSPWVLRALEPAALPLSLEATVRVEHERQTVDQLWRQRLERAAYERDRAARHYRLVEQEHRLVARQLAKEWEEKLTAQRQLQEDYERFLQTQPQVLTGAEREAIKQLAQNIPSLWHAPTTTVADQKELVRQLIQRVIVAGEGLSERVQMTIEWVGGGTTAGLATRPISRIEPLSSYPQLCERMRSLTAVGLGSGQITARLAAEGFQAPKYARPFSRQSVVELMRRLGLHQTLRRQRPVLNEHEWWFADLQREVGCSNSTLHLWRQRGWMQARRHEHGRRWVAWADEAEIQRLKQQGALPAGDKIRALWLDEQYAHTPPSL